MPAVGSRVHHLGRLWVRPAELDQGLLRTRFMTSMSSQLGYVRERQGTVLARASARSAVFGRLQPHARTGLISSPGRGSSASGSPGAQAGEKVQKEPSMKAGQLHL